MDDILSVIEQAKKVPGAISVTEMCVIYKGIIENLKVDPSEQQMLAVDLGSHAGKSSMIASAALTALGRNDKFCMVDLIYNLDSEQWWNTYQGREAKKAGVDVKECIPWPIAKDPHKFLKIQMWMRMVTRLEVGLFGCSSLEFLGQFEGPYSYVFVDSDDHQVELVMAEMSLIELKVAKGGLIFLHDYGNYPGPVRAGQYLESTNYYEKINLDWPWAIDLVRSNNLDEGNDSWAPPNHHYVGCFRRV